MCCGSWGHVKAADRSKGQAWGQKDRDAMQVYFSQGAAKQCMDEGGLRRGNEDCKAREGRVDWGRQPNFQGVGLSPNEADYADLISGSGTQLCRGGVGGRGDLDGGPVAQGAKHETQDQRV